MDITNSAALALVGLVVGGRALYLITLLPAVIRNFDYLRTHLSVAWELLSNGMVFYGGLFGVLITLNIYLRKYRLDRAAFFDYAAPMFPLFHAFGRIGCFLTGCCHGVESERFGIAFTNSISSENGVPYFPVQLLCCLCDLFLFFAVLRFEKRHHREGKAILFYLLLYAVGRFFVEFLRGDRIRGIVAGLSTSQWISLALLAMLLVRFKDVRRMLKREDGSASAE